MSKQKAGRPRVIQTPEEFDQLVNEYVELCTESGSPLTFSGLALHLGFTSRQSLYDYKKREEFSYTAKKGTLED